jgi:hypothetical protein
LEIRLFIQCRIFFVQYTDELAPHMEWLTEKRVLATRDINSNNAAQTEELIEKQEKVLDILDKKRKVGFLVLST